MAQSQQGDKRAYAALLSESRNWLKSYFRRRIGPDSLDDLVQDTLLSMHRKLASYDPERPFLPWLAAIARYRWIDQLRRLSRNNETGIEMEFAVPSDEAAVTARLSLDKLLDRLPQPQAQAIELVKVKGLSIREASYASGQSESLVKVNIHRGLKKLTAMIEKE